MTLTRLLIAASALSLVATAPADAKSRKQYRHHKPSFVYLERTPERDALRARYMALYGGCVQEEGYGRYSPCGVGTTPFGGR